MKNSITFFLLPIFFLQHTVAVSQRSKIPFDNTNAVVYDNDDHRDMYTDEYLLALASAGTIHLKAIITTYSADTVEYKLFVSGRQEIINKARSSGFVNLPDATAGPFSTLKRPASNKIEDTKSLESEAGRVIVTTALQTTAAKPLVIIEGGQLTSIADAYLQDPRIADRIIVSGIFGVKDITYNAGLDEWAWAIVVSKFKCLSISDSDSDTLYNHIFLRQRPQTPKLRFAGELQSGKLPDNIFYEWILEKHHPRHPAIYMEADGDSPAAIPLTRPDYISKLERWRCIGLDPNGLPKLARDKDGPLYLATEGNAAIATEEFWRGIENPAAWHKK